jgi:hypothetical protein
VLGLKGAASEARIPGFLIEPFASTYTALRTTARSPDCVGTTAAQHRHLRSPLGCADRPTVDLVASSRAAGDSSRDMTIHQCPSANCVSTGRQNSTTTAGTTIRSSHDYPAQPAPAPVADPAPSAQPVPQAPTRIDVVDGFLSWLMPAHPADHTHVDHAPSEPESEHNHGGSSRHSRSLWLTTDLGLRRPSLSSHVSTRRRRALLYPHT